MIRDKLLPLRFHPFKRNFTSSRLELPRRRNGGSGGRVRINIGGSSMEAALHFISRTSETPDARPDGSPLLHRYTMHCGYLLLLVLGSWAELAATNPTMTPDAYRDEQSLIESLHDAMSNYTSILQNTNYVRDMMNMSCTKTMARSGQRAVAYRNLSMYPQCAEQLQRVFSHPEVLGEVVILTEDLLRKLNINHPRPERRSLTTAAATAMAGGAAASDTDLYIRTHEPVRCFHCWKLQVEALRR